MAVSVGGGVQGHTVDLIFVFVRRINNCSIVENIFFLNAESVETESVKYNILYKLKKKKTDICTFPRYSLATLNYLDDC